MKRTDAGTVIACRIVASAAAGRVQRAPRAVGRTIKTMTPERPPPIKVEIVPIKVEIVPIKVEIVPIKVVILEPSARR